jgi:hypothetical protein
MMKKFFLLFFFSFCFLLLGGAGCCKVFLGIFDRGHMGQQNLEYPINEQLRIKVSNKLNKKLQE